MIKFKYYILTLLIILSIKEANALTKPNILSGTVNNECQSCSVDIENRIGNKFTFLILIGGCPNGKKVKRIRMTIFDTNSNRSEIKYYTAYQSTFHNDNTYVTETVPYPPGNYMYKIDYMYEGLFIFRWKKGCRSQIRIDPVIEGTISLNKSNYCKGETGMLTNSTIRNGNRYAYDFYKKNNLGSWVLMKTLPIGGNVSQQDDLQYLFNNWTSGYFFNEGEYKVVVRVLNNNNSSSFDLFFSVNPIILKLPLITLNSNNTSTFNVLGDSYILHNICSPSVNNTNDVWLRINRNISLNECEKINEKISITISEFNTTTGATSNTQSITHNISANMTVQMLKIILPTYNLSKNKVYKMVVNGNTYYFKINNWVDCFSIPNPRTKLRQKFKMKF